MKALLALAAALAVTLLFSACESEMPSGSQGIGEKFQKGIMGQGTLYIATPDSASSSLNQGR